MRALLELGGVRDVLTKSLGTTNPINMVRAAEQGLRSLRRPEDIALQRGKTVREVTGKAATSETAVPPAGPEAAAQAPKTRNADWKPASAGEKGPAATDAEAIETLADAPAAVAAETEDE